MWELPPEPPDSDAALPPTTAYDSTAFTSRFPLPPALPFITMMIILLLLKTAYDFVRPTYGAEADAELPPARDYDNCLSTLRTLRSTFAFLLMLMMPLIIPMMMLIFFATPHFKICPTRRSAQNACWTTTFAWCDFAISALTSLVPTPTPALLWPSLAGNYNYVKNLLQALLPIGYFSWGGQVKSLWPVDTFYWKDKLRWSKYGGLHSENKSNGGLLRGGSYHCALGFS